MKTKNILFYVLMFLPLAAVLIALPFLPEQIPAHYDINGAVDRYGSRYEMLLLPALTILFGLFLRVAVRFAAKQEKNGHSNEKTGLTICNAALAVLNIMTGYILYTSFQQVTDLSTLAWDINQIMCAVIGVSMIVVGNIMPKARKNTAFGLRTTWSMKNDVTWKKSQRFGGISFIAAGVLTIIACFVTKGLVCGGLFLAILIVTTVVDVGYTWWVAKGE